MIGMAVVAVVAVIDKANVCLCVVAIAAVVVAVAVAINGKANFYLSTWNSEY